jgi:hypothetical protein
MAPTTDDVRDAFSHLSTFEAEESDLFDGIRVAVDDSEAGELFKTIRVRGFSAESKRFGDTLVSHIEAEESEKSLGELFG